MPTLYYPRHQVWAVTKYCIKLNNVQSFVRASDWSSDWEVNEAGGGGGDGGSIGTNARQFCDMMSITIDREAQLNRSLRRDKDGLLYKEIVRVSWYVSCTNMYMCKCVWKSNLNNARETPQKNK